MSTLSCFKAYDIRGKLGTELNEDIAYRIGRAYAQQLKPRRIVVGGDVRLTSESLKMAVAKGLMDGGVDVVDIGMTGTEEVYFAAFHLDVDGGIEVTASHNPLDYNGMKLVREGARPISGDTGLNDIQALAERNQFETVSKVGILQRQDILADYVNHLMTYIDLKKVTPLKLVVNSGNGAAGHVIDAIEARFAANGVPISFIKVHHEPNGNFPNGIPNPLLPENRAATAGAVREHKADMGIAWDGDFDRCFLFDENGEFIEGYYIVGLLAAAFLAKNPGEKIIHDPRLTWNTVDIVEKAGGVPIQSKTGHAFIKERMRLENAVYGGEMSAHHYFRDFAYCDSGMIPWLLVAEMLSNKKQKLSQLVIDRIIAFPCSGEINYRVGDAKVVVESVKGHFASSKPKIDLTDGISMEFPDFRFNLRSSNTEPLLRLNVEARSNPEIVQYCIKEIEALIKWHGYRRLSIPKKIAPKNEATNSSRNSMNKTPSKFNWLFAVIVILPTLLAILFYGLIASDVYISESHFVVRSPQKQTQTGFGAILQNAGFSRSQDDTYTVHDYMRSRDAMNKIDIKMPLVNIFRQGVDIFSRFNPIGLDDSRETLHRYYQKNVNLDLDSTSSISVLRTRAFKAEDSYQINEMLLQMGEQLINQLNERGRQDMIRFANSEVKIAADNAQKAALALASYRNDQRIFDPEKQSALQLQQISKMQDELLASRAQLAQIQMVSPANPQIIGLQKRVNVIQAAINAETGKVAGAGSSLTSKTADYTRLAQDALLADKQLAAALTSLEQARNDAQRKQLYLERIVQPNRPDVAVEPRRIRSIFSTLILGLVAYGILSMLFAGVREHQD